MWDNFNDWYVGKSSTLGSPSLPQINIAKLGLVCNSEKSGKDLYAIDCYITLESMFLGNTVVEQIAVNYAFRFSWLKPIFKLGNGSTLNCTVSQHNVSQKCTLHAPQLPTQITFDLLIEEIRRDASESRSSTLSFK